MASGDRPDRLRRWNALAIALLIFYLVGIGLFCYAALTTTPVRSPYAITDGPLTAYGDPRAWWPVALQTRPRPGCVLVPTTGRGATRRAASPC